MGYTYLGWSIFVLILSYNFEFFYSIRGRLKWFYIVEYQKKVYTNELQRPHQVIGDNEKVGAPQSTCYESIPAIFGWHYDFYGQECHLYKCHLPMVLSGFWADPWIQLGSVCVGLHVLEVERGLYVEDETGHMQRHNTSGNNYWSFNITRNFQWIWFYLKPDFLMNFLVFKPMSTQLPDSTYFFGFFYRFNWILWVDPTYVHP